MILARTLCTLVGVWTAAAATGSVRGHTGRASRSLTASFVDFSAFSPGDIVTDVATGVNVTTLKRLSDGSLVPGAAMVFDSSAPTGGDFDLATPHFMYGGPGQGEGGNRKSLYPNELPQGKVLIISTDENSSFPDDHHDGGFMTFTFDPPKHITAIGLLDNEEGVHFEVFTADGDSSVFINNSGGNNSFEKVHIGKPLVTSIIVNMIGSGAITFITTGVDPCIANPLFDLEMYNAGDWISSLDGGITVEAKMDDAISSPGPLMVFNTSNPTGGDLDLGSPHKSFDGPGRGKAGKLGSPFENSESLGNVLIISADGNTTDPNDYAQGGDITFSFDNPTYIDSVAVLDNESGCIVNVTSADGSWSAYVNTNGGNNSFERMSIGKPAVVSVHVRLLGSGAITALNGECI